MSEGDRKSLINRLFTSPFNQYCEGLNRVVWRSAVHAVGDAAVDEVVEGFVRANAEKYIPSTLRFRRAICGDLPVFYKGSIG